MANITASFTGGHAVPEIGYYTVGKSQTINRGDLIVLWTEDTTGITVAKKLTATEIAAHYTNTTLAGILGIAACDVVTDANGYATGHNVPSTVAFGAYPLLPIPNYPSSLPGDSANSGRPVMPVIIANDWTEFKIRLQGAGNSAVVTSPDYLNDPVGLQVYNTTDFALNAAATGTDQCAVISRLDELDPHYNVSSALCFVWVKFLPAYQQALTVTKYS